jgi:D-3-phosphoglycerate dehydrogenase
LVESLLRFVSPSFDELKRLSHIFPEKCYVISGGFVEYILPICKQLGFKEDHIIANQFMLRGKQIVDFDRDLPIAMHLGKVNALRDLNLQRPICMIGDGFTDLELKLEGAVDYFLAFTESVYREGIVSKADMECKNFEQVVHFLTSHLEK